MLIGGAAINRNFGRRAALVDGEVFYEPGVFYCKDAFEGLDTMNALIDPGQRAHDGRAHAARGVRVQDQEPPSSRRAPRESRAQQQDFKVTVSRDVAMPAPPFWGARVTPARAIPFAGMFAGMDLKTLYRLHWGARGTGAEFERLIREDFEPRRLKLQREAEEKGWLRPIAVYGYFPCRARARTWSSSSRRAFAPGSLTPRGKIEEVVRFTFPRQAEREGLCLSDYFPPADRSKFDVVAFQVVTVGPNADELGDALDTRGEYAEALFVHGLGVSRRRGPRRVAPPAASATSWGSRPERGKRYSFGYSACPDLADQAKLFRLLKPEDAIGVTLTSAYQLVPEASTSAIIVHHPQAVYYMVKA